MTLLGICPVWGVSQKGGPFCCITDSWIPFPQPWLRAMAGFLLAFQHRSTPTPKGGGGFPPQEQQHGDGVVGYFKNSPYLVMIMGNHPYSSRRRPDDPTTRRERRVISEALAGGHSCRRAQRAVWEGRPLGSAAPIHGRRGSLPEFLDFTNTFWEEHVSSKQKKFRLFLGGSPLDRK